MNGIRLTPDLSTTLALLSAVAFIAVAVWETLKPSRPVTAPMSLRWFGNVVLFVIGWALSAALPVLSAYGAAQIAEAHRWGLLNQAALGIVPAVAIGFVALDFCEYWTHRLFHAIGPLWRLHAIHHSDTDLDVTTAIRHHPLEALVQALLDATAAILIGLPPLSVVLYGGLVLTLQIVHHANVLLPARLRGLSRWLITPDLHRLHHSRAYHESNSNFGNLMPLWDFVFGTLRRTPDETFIVGLAEFADAGSQRLDRLLLQPLKVVVAQAPRS